MKVLLVDDDRELVELLSFGLLQAGFQPLPAFTPLQALEVLEAEQPDLVLLDLRLDCANGLDLLTDIRSQSDVPVIIISGVSSEETKVKAFELGADDYVTKPFGMRELVARLRARLRRPRPPLEPGGALSSLLPRVGAWLAKARAPRYHGGTLARASSGWRLLSFEFRPQPGFRLLGQRRPQ